MIHLAGTKKVIGMPKNVALGMLTKYYLNYLGIFVKVLYVRINLRIPEAHSPCRLLTEFWGYQVCARRFGEKWQACEWRVPSILLQAISMKPVSHQMNFSGL